jgi:predicted phage-related endonuclease
VQRKLSFGGSEMAALLGLNKYKKQRDAIIEKVLDYIRGNKTNHFMAWGTLFEPVHRCYMQEILQTDIYETGAIPCGETKYHKYSPDGICVVNKKVLQAMFPMHESMISS